MALSAGLHAYIGWRLLPSLADWPWVVGALAAMLLLAHALMHLGLQFRRHDHRFADNLSWASMTAMGLFSALFVPLSALIITAIG